MLVKSHEFSLPKVSKHSMLSREASYVDSAGKACSSWALYHYVCWWTFLFSRYSRKKAWTKRQYWRFEFTRDRQFSRLCIQRAEFAWVRAIPGAIVFGEMFDLGPMEYRFVRPNLFVNRSSLNRDWLDRRLHRLRNRILPRNSHVHCSGAV